MFKGKRSVSLALIFFIMLSTVTSFATGMDLIKLEDELKNEFVQYSNGMELSDDEEVEVIVELSDDDFKLNSLVNKELGRKSRIQARSLHSASIDELKTEDGMEIQREYSEVTQEAVQLSMDGEDIDYEVMDSFNVLMNGFAIRTTYGNAKKIAELDYIENVTENVRYDYPRPLMDRSHELIKSKEAWGSSYTGQGMTVAVIDSGIDPEHRDFRISEEVKDKVKWKEEEMKSFIAEKGLKGKWYSDKIPYAYNYSENSHRVKEEGYDKSEHGQHVSGTVGANGKLKGVAPESQIFGMRVFLEGKSTSSSIYMVAMEEAYILGADAINMSLGSPNGTRDVTINKLIEKLGDLGTVVVIAAGNEGQFGYTAASPKANAPDYGVVGTPSTAPNALSVASFENTHKKVDLMKLSNGKEIKYFKRPIALGAVGKTFEVLPAGLGLESDFKSEDFTGKAALIERGDITFVEKINNAEAAGASFAIIYNNEANDNSNPGELINMGTKGTKIPSASISRSDALMIMEEIKKGKFSLEVLNQSQEFKNEKANYMSDFSSWGMSTDFTFKPEITAPGGNIYSTLNDDEYGMMGGTSMASPHVAGGVAILKDRINDDFPNLNGIEKRDLNKNIMMSTANPIIHPNTNAQVSPRKQGAGMMNLDGAMRANVIVYDPETKISKVNLGKALDPKFDFDLELMNYSDKKTEYSVKTYVNTNQVKDGKFTLESEKIIDIDNGSISLEANSNSRINIKVDIFSYHNSLMQVMPNGYFAEGFVVFTPIDSNDVEISIPYVGFVGNFDKVPILEEFIYNMNLEEEYPIYHNFEKSETHSTHLGSSTLGLDEENNLAQYYTILGFDKGGDYKNIKTKSDKIAISPNGDGIRDEVTFKGVFNRDTKGFEINVFEKDGDGNKGKNIYKFDSHKDYIIEKNMHLGDDKLPKSTRYRGWEWLPDGQVEDGTYIFEVSGRSAYGSELQTYGQDVIVDRQVPKVDDISFDETSKVVTIKVDEKGSGVKYFEIKMPSDEKYIELEEKSENLYELIVPEGIDLKDIEVSIMDWAYNTFESNLADAKADSEFGSIRISTKIVEKVTEDPVNIDYEVRNSETGDLVENLSQVPYGKYKIKPINLPVNIDLAKGEIGEKEVEISPDKKVVTLEFNFIESKIRTVYIKNTSEYEEEIGQPTNYKFTSQNGKEIFIKSIELGKYFTSGSLPYGEYSLEVDQLADGWLTIPEKVKYIHNEDSENFLDIDIKRVGDVGSIKIKSVDSSGEEIEDLKTIKYIADNYGTIYDDLSRLSRGSYEVKPVLETIPEDYYTLDLSKRVILEDGNMNEEISFVYDKSNGEKGSLSIESINSTGEDINMVYTLKNSRGQIVGENQTEFKDLDFGRYTISAGSERTRGYIPKFSYSLSREKIVDIVPSEANPSIEFEWIRLSEVEKKGKVAFKFENAKLHPRYETEVVEMDIKDMDGKIIDVNQKLSEWYFDQEIELAYGEYDLLIKNKANEDYYISPEISTFTVQNLSNNVELKVEKREEPLPANSKVEVKLKGDFESYEGQVELNLESDKGDIIELDKVNNETYEAINLKAGDYTLRINNLEEGWSVDREEYTFYLDGLGSGLLYDKTIEIEFIKEIISKGASIEVNISLENLLNQVDPGEDTEEIDHIIKDQDESMGEKVESEDFIDEDTSDLDNIGDLQNIYLEDKSLALPKVTIDPEDLRLVIIDEKGKIKEDLRFEMNENHMSYMFENLEIGMYTLRLLKGPEGLELEDDGLKVDILNKNQREVINTSIIVKSDKNLERVVDNIRDTIKRFKNLNKEYYKPEEIREIQDLINKIEDLLEETSPNINELLDLEFEIIERVDKLKLVDKELDLREVEDLLDQVNKINKDIYTESSLSKLEKVRVELLAAIKNTNTSQNRLDDLANKLRKALNELEKKEESKPNPDEGGIREPGVPVNPPKRDKDIIPPIKLPEVEIKTGDSKNPDKKFEFVDLDEVAWAKAAIIELAKRDIIVGKTKYEFKPNDKITRAEFSAMIVRMFDLKPGSSIKDFQDVRPSDWYYGEVNILASNGIISGRMNNKFDPNGKITREEMGQILINAIKIKYPNKLKPAVDVKIKDEDQISSWAVENIKLAKTNEILVGNELGNINPKKDGTRAEAASILYRTIEVLKK